MEPRVRVLVVDDYEPWCRLVASMLNGHQEFLIVGEASDGVTAVQKAQELLPDLILLDIGLPGLNGVDAARKIRELAPNSKILFISENRSWAIAEAALRTGAFGYILKSNAESELLLAAKAVMKGKQFVGAGLARHLPTHPADETSADHASQKKDGASLAPENAEIVLPHEVVFYSDYRRLLDRVAQFVATALISGNVAVVAATESHREGLIPRLQAYGVDISAAIQRGRYLALDAAATLSKFMVNGMPDPHRFMQAFGNLIMRAAEASEREHSRVAIFGECVELLCEQGNVEAAIQMEKLGNRLAKLYDVDILCAYSLAMVPGGIDSPTFQRICAEHSAFHVY